LIKFSTLTNAFDAHPVNAQASWPQLLDALSAYAYRSVKEMGPLISPATFAQSPEPCKCHGQPGLVRKLKSCVEAVHFLALDFDDVSTDTVSTILRALEPYAAITYTTWKQPEASAKGLMRFRAMLPMTRPCSAAEWPTVYRCAVRDFGASALDESCKDPNRFYFTPALPLDASGNPCTWAAQTWRSPGSAAWDVDQALAKPMAAESSSPERSAATIGMFQAGSDPIPREAVLRLSAKLEKRDDPKDIRLGTLLRAGLDGHALTEGKGQRHVVLRDLAWRLAQAFPTGSTASLAEHFALALDFMREGAAEDPVKHFQDLIASAQRKVQETAHEAQAGKLVGASRNILKAFEGLGQRRSVPYTPEELAAFATQSGGDMSSRWILQAGSAIWLFFAGDYVGPFQREAIGPACAQWLSPASSAGVEVYKYDDKGNVKIKDLHELVGAYGRVITTVEADMSARHAYLVPARSAIVEAPCPLRALEPAYSPEIDAWLHALAGPKYDRLCDWIACVTFLRECTPAIFVKGASGVGKNMLALGLARLWSETGPTPMTHAMGEFNAQVVQCPLVYADEQIPETFRGEPRTEELRELISACTFKINQKNRPVSTARGSVRVIIGANNFNVISRKAELTPEDAQALADRFILIDAGTDDAAPARDYLTGNGGPNFTRSWVEGDKIAKHALWLRAEVIAGRRILQRGSRFILPGDAHELVTALQTASRVPSDLLEWVWQFLQDPAKHVSASVGRPLACLIKDGAIWINARGVLQCWDHYMAGERAPTANAFARTTRGVVLSERKGGRLRLGHGGSKARYHQLNLESLAAWLKGRDESLQELPALLEQETEQLAAPGTSKLN
jgi:hypothetical protein